MKTPSWTCYDHPVKCDGSDAAYVFIIIAN